MTEPLHVLVSGAAGQIGYVLSFRIANGDLFGDHKIVLHLLEIRPAMEMLNSVVMELNDCTFPNLVKVIGTCETEEAFKDVDVAFLMGSIPKKKKMSMETYLERNWAIFKEHGEALSKYSKPTAKVLVVGLPANTNCLVAATYAKNIPKENFCAMTRLDHNRAVGILAKKLKVSPEKIKRVVVWGNRSLSQVSDATNATCDGKSVKELLSGEYLNSEFPESLVMRQNAITGMKGRSTAASAAHAALCHMKNWIYGTPEGDFVSMAIPVPDNEPYGIGKGIVFSFPCVVDKEGKIHVVEGLELSPHLQQKIKETEKEVRNEAKIVESFAKGRSAKP